MKTENKKTLRGSVLFTVVCVMALLVIFLTGTLALASASNNRAHKSYASSQASYTAKAAITSFTEAMQRDEGIVAAVQNMTGPLYPEVTIKNSAPAAPGTNPDNTMGVVGYYDSSNTWHANRIIVEPMGYYDAGHEGDPAYFHKETNWVYMDDGSGPKWTEVETVKITATCRVAKEEATISAYIKKKGSSGTNVPQTSKIKGLNTAGDGSFANGGMFTGGLGVGLKNSSPSTFLLNNACTAETSLTFVNGDLFAKTGSLSIKVKDSGSTPCSETVINGSLFVPNNPLVQLMSQYKMTSNYTQKQIPYLYVDGGMYFKSTITIVDLEDTSGDIDQPFNVFAGTIETENNLSINGDLYLMDEYNPRKTYKIETDQGDITLTAGDNIIKSSGSNNLYRWAENVATCDKTEDLIASHGGNIYCNGNLTIGAITIDGDVRVMGDCVINKNTTINGDLIVKGNLYIEEESAGKSHLKSVNKIYCDHVFGANAGTSGYRSYNNEYVEASDTQLGNLQKKTLPTRDLLEWNVGSHEGKTPGGEDEEAWKTLYYTWNAEYAPGMKLYQNNDDGSFTYAYADENFTDEAYTFVGNVDDIITSAKNGQLGTWDDKTTYALKTFINVDSGKLENELPHKYHDEYVNEWYTAHIDDGVMKSYPVYLVVVGTDTAGDPIYRETSIQSADDFMWYDSESQTLLTDAETWTHQDAYYLLKNFDGETTNERVGFAVAYYRESDQQLVSEYEATHTKKDSGFDASKITSYASYGAEAYPESMKRENIYGTYDQAGKFTPADAKTKIIKNLDEVRKEMDYDYVAKGFSENVYLTKVPSGHDCSKNAYVKTNPVQRNTDVWSSNGYIKEDCTLKGIAPEVITINPEGKEIWVVLDNFKLDGKDQSTYREIIVDLTNPANGLQEGKVCFLIKGTLNLKGSAIVNKELKDGVAFDYKKDWGIEFFGEKNTKIVCDQQCQFTGSFKCPFTTYKATHNGIYTADYTDEYGVNWKTDTEVTSIDITNNKPPIVGNALFSDIEECQNGFGLYYTESGQSGKSGGGQSAGFNTALGYYELGYFAGS
ncbi:hypothetical protein [Ruminococcus flavefaciens]|uniref:hypothetical protein n=1 Tax=Ruminococcus flavefaciens TaxID=1265 RepID=UPI0026EAEB1A|nr:hypothetical protein [Ruminococcus flavefaciens]MDD7517947.1 hypothetical protein [Ruminococcus flavefaciens]MDY5692851.1 hypothetical protein [Ruminococcus flavefaciens]